MERRNAWLSYTAQEKVEMNRVNEAYKAFLDAGKTERECVTETIRQAKEAGYTDLEQVVAEGRSLQSGDKVYAAMKGKAIALFHIGTEPMEKGMNILGAHIDSPRLDLKQNPVYEDTEQVLLKTHYYGGVKKYQWVAMPLAMHGVIAKKDDTVVTVSIGEDERDPIFYISDLLPHMGADQMQKKGSEIIEGENMNILLGNEPLADVEKEAVKANILKILEEQLGVEEEDFISAEIEMVPAGRARDLGLDRSMVCAYGQDDRICGYTSLAAQLALEAPVRTAVCLLVDKEEIGSVGATGMHSRFFENAVAELMNALGQFSAIGLRRALANSCMLSSDVTSAYDPNYAYISEKKNCCYMGHGLCFSKYTGSRGKSGANDANAEFIARIRRILDEAGVAWQTSELGRVDQGGGGTISYITAHYGMDVIDAGIGLLSMHAPWEVASKADIYEGYKGYLAFLKNA